jgi:hypothetical protein
MLKSNWYGFQLYYIITALVGLIVYKNNNS